MRVLFECYDSRFILLRQGFYQLGFDVSCMHGGIGESWKIIRKI